MWITENPVENAVQMEVANWRKGVTNWRKGVANWRKGVEQIRNVNHGEIHLKMQCKWKWQIGGREWQTGGREWQTGGRDKSSSTAAPSALLRVLSLKKFDFTCGRYQLCKPFSTFYENFSHNLPLKKNSPVLDPSFSRPSTQEGRGTWLATSWLRILFCSEC